MESGRLGREGLVNERVRAWKTLWAWMVEVGNFLTHTDVAGCLEERAGRELMTDTPGVLLPSWTRKDKKSSEQMDRKADLSLYGTTQEITFIVNVVPV